MTLTLGQRIRSEFHARKFLLNHECPGIFARSEYVHGPSVLYLIWRWVWAAFHICCIVVSGEFTRVVSTTEPNRVKYFVLLTNWCYICLTITTLIDVIVASYFYFSRKDDLRGSEGPLPWYCKVLWVFSNISNSSAFLTCFLYWPLIYNPTLGLEGLRISSFFLHGMNALYVFLNLLVTAMPVRLLHFYQPFIFGLVYAIFSGIYDVAGGTNYYDSPYIYKFIDWSENPGLSTGICVGVLLAVVLLHMGVYFLHLIRIYFSDKYTTETTVAVIKV